MFQSRDEVRRVYLDVWQKMTSASILEPMEALIAEVIELHPEYHALLADQENAKQALLAFTGDVYTGLDAPSFDDSDFDFAQQHLRILSGLYGVLRPLDLMQPYRLEMGVKLRNKQGDNLYQFWGKALAVEINRQLEEIGSSQLINLASNEYFKSVDNDALNAEVVRS